MKPIKTILAIDTSCDETAVAVTQGRKVISNVLSSQVEIHKKYGGVFPTEAKRAHQEKIDHVVKEAVKRAEIILKKSKENLTLLSPTRRGEIPPLQAKRGLGGVRFGFIDAIAVTVGPGLAPALEVGIRKAKELTKELKKPLIAVNHMEGHLLSVLAQNAKGKPGKLLIRKNSPNTSTISGLAPLLKREGLTPQPQRHTSSSTKLRVSSREEIKFPILSLLVSGGHTELVVIRDLFKGEYEVIGRTRDDSAGEAFDKVARMLNLGYPGGEVIELIAKEGDDRVFDFPVPMARESGLDFSFSGLKTAVMYELNKIHKTSDIRQIRLGQSGMLDKRTLQNLAASFQRVVIKALVLKVERAVRKMHPKAVWIGGGVGANSKLRSELRRMLKKYGLKLYVPYSKKLYTDNSAMIGVAAYFKMLRGEFVEDVDALDRQPGLDL